MFTKRDCEGFHRRDFLQIGSAGLLGLTPAAASSRSEAQRRGQGGKAKAKGVILVWLAGGPATIDMWDNKPEAPEGIRGEFKSIDTKAKGVQFSEHLPEDGRGRRQGQRRPFARPHHPVARAGHRVHDHRQQADRGPAVPGDGLARARSS